MNPSLLVLCLAAFAMVSLPISGLVYGSTTWLDRLAAKMSPRHRGRLWLGLAGLPTLTGLLAIGASLMPAMGLGHDHCLAHGPHHPHLCPHHAGGGPGMVLVFVALLFGGRLAVGLVAFARGVRSSRGTSGVLAEASERHADALVFPADEPQAFVLGVLRPRIHVSRGLLALGSDIVEPVLAHERVHTRRRDLLWRALCPVLAVGHFPSVMQALGARLAAAQELAADEEAAATLADGRVKIAEALVTLARLARTPAPGISFTHGDIEARVHALLDGGRVMPAWPPRILLLCALLVPLAVGLLHDPIHHGLETALGALS